MAMWVFEGLFSIAAPDRWAQPLFALVMLGLYAGLKRYPNSMVTTQRIRGVHLCSVLRGQFGQRVVHGLQHALPYFLVNNLMWMPVIALAFQLAFPWRWAVALSLGLLGLVACGIA